MKRTLLKLALGFAIIAVVALGATLYFTREPRLEGRKLSEWVAELNHPEQARRVKAEQVLREAGPKVIPFLAGEIEHRENRFESLARSIGRRMPEKIRSAGRKLFGSKTVWDKLAAAKALELMGTNATSAVPALTNALRDPHTALQQQASAALGQMPEAVPALITALDDPSYDVRTHACLALRKLGPQASNAVPRLMQIVTNEPGAIVTLATFALSSIGQPAIPSLTESLFHTNAHIRKLSAETLGNMDAYGVPAVPALVQAAKDPDAVVREKAIGAIAKIDRTTPEADTALIEALNETNQMTRALAVEAIASRPRAVRHHIQVLERLVDDPNPKVRETAQAIVSQYKERLARRENSR